MSSSRSSGTGFIGNILNLGGLSLIAGVLVTALVAPFAAIAGVGVATAAGVFDSLPDYISLGQLSQRNTIYGMKNGEYVPIAYTWDQNRIEVGLEEISDYAKWAAIAGEDPSFYQHNGVDIKGASRGLLGVVIGKDLGGGSTIDMQTVRNWLKLKAEAEGNDDGVDAALEVSFERKLKEMKLALQLNKQYTKDEILNSYLNMAHFGGVVYGIEAAAKTYYSKSAKDLTIAEAASLMAIVQYPNARKLDMQNSSNNGEANGYALNKARRDYIINKMHEHGYISAQEAAEAITTPVEPVRGGDANGCMSATTGKFFCDMVMQMLTKDPILGETSAERVEVRRLGGLHIYTSLEIDAQIATEASLKKYVPQTDTKLFVGGSVASVEVGTGRILVLAQNRDYNPIETDPRSLTGTAVNYSTNYRYGGSSGFQVGSTFKLFTLIEWLEAGYPLNQIVDTRVRNYPQFAAHCVGGFYNLKYEPKNAGKFATSMSALQGTISSVNTAFLTMAEKLDLCDIAETATKLGAGRADGRDLVVVPSMVLGSNESSPLAMAEASAAIQNGGIHCPSRAIDSIEDRNGTVIYTPEDLCERQIAQNIADTTAYAMRLTVTGGLPYIPNSINGQQTVGKTGTTNDYVDNWMLGGTKKVATASWVGNVVGKVSMNRFSWQGYRYDRVKYPIWIAAMNELTKTYNGGTWAAPDSSLVSAPNDEIPQVLGQSIEEATALLEAAGFYVQIGSGVNSDHPGGTVAYVSPQVGTSVTRGTLLTVHPSLANMTAITPQTSNLVSVGAFQSYLNSRGFTNFTINQTVVPDGTPGGPHAAGTVIKWPAVALTDGATITIEISDGTAPPPTP